MKKIITIVMWACFAFLKANGQCTTTNAKSCVCAQSASFNCDLLPDVMVAKQPLQTIGTYGVMEYAYNDPSSKKSQLRVTVSTPNIGRGPLEVHALSTYVCGTDTIVGTAPAICPNTGLAPKQLLVQRIYHKDTDKMTFYDRPAGSMTYHPTHGHMHVDDWGIYTLRTATSDPNPLKWPIISQGNKISFCLMDYGYCSSYNNHCTDTDGTVLTNQNIKNYGLGGAGFTCSNVVQGISVGYLDIYYQYLDGMEMKLDSNICNGDYWLVVQIDPNNNFLESNENNNVVAVPYTLTKQRARPDLKVTSTINLCRGSSTTLSATGASNYSWKGANGYSSTNMSVKVSPANTTMYTVTGYNTGYGCVDTDYVVVNVIDTPKVTLTAPAKICTGTTATIQVAGGAYYKWNPNITNNDSLITTVAVSPVQQTTYTVNAYNLQGCSSSMTQTITPSQPVLSSNITNAAICEGTTRSITVSGAQNYSWLPSTGLNCSSISNVICSPTASTTYTVTGTDMLGCSATATISITVNPIPTVSITPLATSYFNTVTNVPLSGSPSNGVFSGPGVAGTIFNPYNVTPAACTITYSYTDSKGCTGMSTTNTSVVYTCSKPTGIFVDNVLASSARINWSNTSSAPQFKIKYKKSTSTIWTTITIPGDPHVVNYTLTGLSPNTTYNYNIKPNCGLSTNQSITYNFTTLVAAPFKDWLKTEDTSNPLTGMYPNPSKGNFNIDVESEVVQQATIQLIDITGKVVYNKDEQVIEGMNTISVKPDLLTAGIYAVRLIIGQEVFTSNIVIEK